MTDPIADMLTRVRNAIQAKHQSVAMPASNMKQAIAKILKENGYIHEFKVNGDVKKELSIKLKYKGQTPAISGLKRISKPGLRVTVSSEKMPKVLNGLGTAIVSTSKGVMTSSDAKANNLGGEVLAYVW